MSARQSTMATDKKRFLEKYREIIDRGCDEDAVMDMTAEHYGGFYVQKGLAKATFDPKSKELNPVVVIAFCKAFDLPIDDRGKVETFEKKSKFLILYDSVLKQQNLKRTEVLEMINGYCCIPEGTFNDTINQHKLNFNATVVIAFCRTFGFDIDLIFREGEGGKQTSPLSSIQSVGNTVDTELPNGFEGRFYGYFFNSTPDYAQQGRLDQFTLDISNREVKMILRHFALDSANKYAPREISLRGKIIHNPGGSSPSGMLAIAFHSEDDSRFCALAYSKLQLSGPLHFRKGAMLIQSRGGEGPVPVMQSFIFTDKKIDLEIPSNRRILQGALALTDDAIRLEKGDLEPFMDSEALREYFRRVSFETAVRQYIELDEVDLRRLNVGDKDELYRVLLQMKADAAAPRLFRFPNSSADRSWRCVSALGAEEPVRQEDGGSQEE